MTAALDINDGTDTDVEGSATVVLSEESTTGSEIDIEATNDVITTLNIIAAADQTAGDLTLDIQSDVAVVLTGAGDVDVVTTSVTAGESSLDASGLTGDMTATVDAQMLEITGGSGDDTITAVTTLAFDLDGGAGDDTLVTAADMTSGTFTGFEILTITDGDEFLSSQLNGLEAVVSDIGGAGIIELTTGGAGGDAIDTTTVDLRGLTMASAADVVDANLGNIDAAAVLAGAAITYHGTSAVDQVDAGANGDTINTYDGADVVTGGAGDDTITTGEGIDSVTSGDGNDTIDLTEATAAVDTLNYAGDDGAADVDTVTGFDTGATDDLISLDADATTTAITVGDATGAAATAAGAVVVTDHADDTDLDLSTDTDETIIKLTDAGATFAAAIGTGEITVADTAVMTFLWYDSDTNEAVFGYADEATAADASNVIASDDTFVEITRLALTADEYTALGTDNFVMV